MILNSPEIWVTNGHMINLDKYSQILDVDVEAATEGREREIRLCLLHIGFRVEKLLEGARRIQSMGS